MKFEDFSFDPRIEVGIKAAGYETPTPIQAEAIPIVLQGHDLLGLAQTGTGKTAAFLLPILQRLTKGPLRQVRALIVTPTRELAEQIYQASFDFGRKTRIRSTAIYGGVSKRPQETALHRGVEIVVACPGRLLDLVGDGSINLSQVEILVLDEADRMCDMGFLPDIRRIIKQLPTERQTLFFSATMPNDIRKLADTILNDPITVQIGRIAPAKTVSHALFPVPKTLRKKLLLAFLQRTATGRVLVFTRTKRRAHTLALDLAKRGYRVTSLQGNMRQSRRQQAINGYRSGKYDILVATDIAARGIDVTEISHVINFDIPDTVDAYTHRIGRTGRAEQTGEAITFAIPDDAAMVHDIEKTLKTNLERRRLPDFDYGDFDPETQFQAKSSPRPKSKQNAPKAHRGSGHKRPHRGGSKRKPYRRFKD
ncbi:DEAD/DEAH box helicase [Anaerolineales bacterium HSG6]|nr:DEAD/DEAH box helicase [Anaerolineales bacterium HSG6]